jgi:hypothetical protein
MDPEAAKLLRLILAELRKITGLLAVEADAEPAPVCPEPGCGSLDLEDTSAGKAKRLTCLSCGKSFTPEVSGG